MATETQRGFSLLEMAIVLAILGVLMGGVLVAVSQSVENGRRASARAQLQQVEEALYAYAQIIGTLPPPVDASGNELVGTGPYHGYVPTAALGLNGTTDANGLLLDPWRNPLRYSLFTSNITALYATFSPDNELLSVCAESDCEPPTTRVAPAVVLSMGANWSSYTSAYEQSNVKDPSSNNVFISRDYNESQFDDQLVWLSPYLLFTRMISAGTLNPASGGTTP